MSESYEALLKKVSPSVRIVAVSKFEPNEALQKLYDAGCRDFAESRVQEALAKKEALPQDIRWHLIGRLQSNKINKVIGAFSLIHSIDDYELLKQVDKAAGQKNLVQPVLLQVKTADDKQGLTPDDWLLFKSTIFSLKNVLVKGLMTIGPHTKNEEEIRKSFALLRTTLRAFQGPETFCELSMGMSEDWRIAIEEGATILRIGRELFGKL